MKITAWLGGYGETRRHGKGYWDIYNPLAEFGDLDNEYIAVYYRRNTCCEIFRGTGSTPEEAMAEAKRRGRAERRGS